MNRYPLWKYLVIVVALTIGVLYTLPNFYGEAPAVQVSSLRATSPVDTAALGRVEQALAQAGIQAEAISQDAGSIRARFKDTDTQLRARDVIEKALIANTADPGYVVALNLLPRSPAWLTSIGANPMYLGLDLRGGVHFMLQIDMAAALDKRSEALTGDIRTLLRDKNIRHSGIARNGTAITIDARDEATANAVGNVIREQLSELQFATTQDNGNYRVTATITQQAARSVQELALKQNMTTLRNRINELGVAEPIIQQQGLDRIVVQLPGVQDTAKAKDILGRTATLEVRMVDETSAARAAEASGGPVPFGSERYADRNGQPIIVKTQVILTGENLTDAQPSFDQQTREAVVSLTLDAQGARIFRDVTRENVGKRMAILLFEKGRGEVVTAPVIRQEIGGGRVQISGSMSTQEANDTALLLRAGSLAAPMEIIEERTIGPSLGAENITKGFQSVLWGFIAILAFMSLYYMLFGVFSSIAMAVNLLLLVAVLSMLQATLTLPGIAAMALALGMAIDSNVLINERIREELRAGTPPQAAIHAGFDRAWATILDSNISTLIAALALLAFGSGPVRGFAVVHSLGILTSMFSAVFFMRGLVNLWYGRRHRLKKLSIGQIWKAEGQTTVAGRGILADDDEQPAAKSPERSTAPAVKAAAPAPAAGGKTSSKLGAAARGPAAGQPK